MTKAELIEKMADEAGITKVATEKMLNSFMDLVKDALANDNKITLVGFGTFSTAERSARVGRNPQTGESINIKAKKVVKFKPGKALAEAVA